MFNKQNKNASRVKRHLRVRNKISGTAQRPRLCVYRSLKGITVQIVNDQLGHTLVSASTKDADIAALCKGKTKVEASFILGTELAKKAINKKIKTVVFDRGGYLFAGRVKAVADAARENGLEF